MSLAAPTESALLPAARHEPDELLQGPDTHQTIASHCPELPAHAVGQTIGRYQLIEKIGEGGCGVVYVAEQYEPVRRRVALKVVKLGMDTQEVIARFEAERQALALMDHPNIARVLDAGTTGETVKAEGRMKKEETIPLLTSAFHLPPSPVGRPFFVMELFRGARITEFCESNALSIGARLDLFIKVCQAIQHAHQKGIVHRDIKPSNILVALHDGEPVPKVIDFGIAKAIEGRLTDATVHTQLHHFLGTPAYMSPEQAEMRGMDIDTRSDIYSLGVLLYELLTGKPPFDPRELCSGGLDGMRRIIRETEPVLPSVRLRQARAATAANRAPRVTRHASTGGEAAPASIADRNAIIDPDLDCIVMKCLEKDRSRRYETANGLAADLKRHLNNEPVVARPPSAGYRLQKAIRRNRLIFASGTAVLLALVTGFVLNTRQLIQVNRLKLELRDQVREARTARAEAEAIASFLVDALTRPLPSRDGRTVTIEETLDRVAYRLNHEAPAQFSDWPRFQNAVAETYRAYGMHDKAVPLLEKVLQHFTTTLEPDDAETLAVMNRLADSYSAVERPAEALRLREAVLEHRLQNEGLGRPEVLTAMGQTAVAFEQAGIWDQALDLRQQLVDRHRESDGPSHLQTLAALRRLGDVYESAGRGDDAIRTWEGLLPLLRSALGRDARETLRTLDRLATAYTARGWHTQALTHRWDILDSNLNNHGPVHPETVDAIFLLAKACEASGRRTEAEQLREGVVSALDGGWPPGANHPLRNLVTHVGQRLGIMSQSQFPPTE